MRYLHHIHTVMLTFPEGNEIRRVRVKSMSNQYFCNEFCPNYNLSTHQKTFSCTTLSEDVNLFFFFFFCRCFGFGFGFLGGLFFFKLTLCILVFFFFYFELISFCLFFLFPIIKFSIALILNLLQACLIYFFFHTKVQKVDL